MLGELETPYLFVYGTLRYRAEGRMSRLLSGSSDYIGAARYQGKLYKVDYYPGMVPSSNPQDQVLGDVFRLRKPTQTLAALDNYEGIGPGFDEPFEYERILQPVILANGDTLSVWVYLFRYSVDGLAHLPSGDFLSDD